jgi:hypothetical protein
VPQSLQQNKENGTMADKTDEFDELEDLLGELDIENSETPEVEPAPDSPIPPVEKPKADIPVINAPPPVVDVLEPMKQELLGPESDEPQVITSEVLVKSTVEEVLDVKQLIKDHDKSYCAIQENLVRDRAKIDSVVSILLAKVEVGASSAETEALVKALAVLTDTNGHAVRLLDTKTKLMSSAKSTIAALTQNIINTGGGGNEDLKALLANIGENDEV